MMINRSIADPLIVRLRWPHRGIAVTLLATLLTAALPVAAGAAPVTLATYNSLTQSSPFCGAIDPCDFLVVTLESDVIGILGGLSVDYFESGAATPIASDTLPDELSNDPATLLSNFAIFLSPIPDTAASALIVASSLQYSEANGMTLVTTPLLLPSGTGLIQLETQVVPEPANTLTLLGSAAVGLMLWRRSCAARYRGHRS